VNPQQLEAERRRGRIAGIAAIASGIVFALGAFWYQSINSDAPEKNSPALLRFFDRHAGELLGASILQGIGMSLVVIAGVHLYRATKARDPKATPVVQVMAIYGPIAFALSTVIRAIALAVLASDFTGRDFQTLDAADDVFKNPVLIAATVIGFSGVIALAYWLVKGSLDAMRVGLLTRFMGWIGVAMGPALILGFGTLLLPVWLIALGAMFLGLWPRGAPPAWEEGRAVPWPNLSPARAGEQLVGGSRNGEVEPVGPAVRKDDKD
jgi:MFS family permease